MQFLNRLSIRSKLYAGFAVVSAALLVAVAVGWISMLSVSSALRPGFEKAVDAEATSKWAYNMRVSQSQSAAIGRAITNADGSDMHASDVAAYAKEFNHLTAMARSQDDHAAITRIKAAHTKWSALDQKVTSLTNAGQKHAALELANGVANAAGDTLSMVLDRYAAEAQASAKARQGSRGPAGRDPHGNLHRSRIGARRGRRIAAHPPDLRKPVAGASRPHQPGPPLPERHRGRVDRDGDSG
jgi:hypothetical protein